jgi:hypothetical protein
MEMSHARFRVSADNNFLRLYLRVQGDLLMTWKLFFQQGLWKQLFTVIR